MADAPPESTPKPLGPLGIRERFPELIGDFRKIARVLLRKLPSPSLASDDLVNEAYLRLMREEMRRLQCQRSGLASKPDAVLKACFGAACRDVMSMRWRKRRRRTEVGLIREDQGRSDDNIALADIHEMLSVLSASRPETAQVVEARVFGDLTVLECAEIFGVSPATVDRRWALGRAWIKKELKALPGGPGGGR